MKNKCKQFECKDEVIYQNRINFENSPLIWNYGIVNYEDEEYVYLVGGLYINKNTFKILPYEGNEHLVGTTYEPDEEVMLEKGDDVICFDSIINFENSCKLYIAKFWRTNEVLFKTVNNENYIYAIRFSDFNPNDMEETAKHILCVKNGKIVKYKS